MSREYGSSPVRLFAVWAGVTAAATAAAVAVPATWRAAARVGGAEGIDHVLVAACTTGLALSLAWLWLVTSLTVAQVAVGSVPRGGGATRRLVFLACGVAVTAGTTLPAHAAGGGGADVLVGLPLPERAVSATTTRQPRTTAPAATGGTYVVRPGDSLWSIARSHPAPGTDVESRWREIWRLNRDVVGADPDLIHPGQALRLPETEPHTEKDGERR
jgi:nucleoid-associated protein YgaU